MLRRANRHLEHLAAGSPLAKQFGLVEKGFDQDALPAVLLQQPGLAAVSGVVGADFDEKTVRLFLEMFPKQRVFAEL